MMRWVYIGVVVLIALVAAVFALQNIQWVTISFLGFRAQAPMAFVAIVSYLLGMATGSSLFAVIRRSIEGSRDYSR